MRFFFHNPGASNLSATPFGVKMFQDLRGLLSHHPTAWASAKSASRGGRALVARWQGLFAAGPQLDGYARCTGWMRAMICCARKPGARIFATGSMVSMISRVSLQPCQRDSWALGSAPVSRVSDRRRDNNPAKPCLATTTA